MKSILRSPIEPEFAELVKKKLRERRETYAAAVAEFFAWVRQRARTLRQKAGGGVQALRDKANQGKEAGEATIVSLLDAVKERAKKIRNHEADELPGDHPSALKSEPADESVLAHPETVPSIRDGEGEPVGFSEAPAEKNLFGRLKLVKIKGKYFILGLLLVGTALGAGIKSLARDTVTIGFEDYKAGRADAVLDLNQVQAKVMSESGTTVPSGQSPTEGEQCTE